MPKYQSDAIRIARQLGYNSAVIDKLTSACSEREINFIMITARKTVIKAEEIHKSATYIFTPHCRGVVRYTA